MTVRKMMGGRIESVLRTRQILDGNITEETKKWAGKQKNLMRRLRFQKNIRGREDIIR